MKNQVDAFYKHYCENASEGNAPPPIAAPVAVAAAAPSIDYSQDISAIKFMMKEIGASQNYMRTDFSKRIDALEQNQGVIF